MKHAEFVLKNKKSVGWAEVLVACAIVALLLQLLLPALQVAREAARRRSCVANLRRLGDALLCYSAVHGHLPPAAYWDGSQIDLTEFPRAGDTVPATRANWAELLLPFLYPEIGRLEFDMTEPVVAATRPTIRKRSAPWMRCPSDSYAVAENPYVHDGPNGETATFARGNYAINGGVQNIYEAPGTLMGPRPLGTRYSVDLNRRECQWWGTGVAGFNKSFRLDSMANGHNTTVLLDEVRAGIHKMDPRGVWALGQIGGSVTWGHGVIGDACGPNPKNGNADDILRGDRLHSMLSADFIAQQGMTFCDHCDTNAQASSRSMHPGGVNLLLCDGVSRFVTNQIDSSVWHVLHSRQTPASFLEDVWKNPTRQLQQRESGERRNTTGRCVDRSLREYEITNSIGMRFRWIPAGTFTMGLPDRGNDSNVPTEVPPHEVRITSGFLMGIWEVTRGQYRSVMGSDAVESLPAVSDESEQEEKNLDEYPMSNVTWYNAAEFCRRLNGLSEERLKGRTYGLPTEAQWEYCCRSGSTLPHVHLANWIEGDNSGEIAAKAWREDPPTITPVGSFKANASGLYDMRGNVWEWCSDWFGRDYYAWSRTEDPEGPAGGSLKVYRGTDWVFTGNVCKTGSRALPPWRRSPYIGFRVVCAQNFQR